VEVSVVADDLSGAMEAASMFLLRTTRIDVTLGSRRRPDDLSEIPPRVHVLDTDSRHMKPEQAAAAVGAAWDQLGAGGTVIKKVDSLLRGHPAAEIEQVLTRTSELVIAVALPARGRTVVEGRLLVDGIPLSATDLWRTEGRPPAEDVAAAFGTVPTVAVNLSAVRAGTARLAQTMRSAVAGGYIPICDGRTDADLDEVVGAARLAFHRPVLIGSAALAAAMARDMAPDPAVAGRPVGCVAERPAQVPQIRPGILVVVGTNAPTIASQLDRLRVQHPELISIATDDLFDSGRLAALSDQIRTAVAARPLTVAYLDPSAEIRPSQASRMVQGLAVAVTAGADLACGLLLTGGETARRVLDQLGVDHLQPLSAVHHGAVVSLARGQRAHPGPGEVRLVATRPGSFGDVDSLAAMVSSLYPRYFYNKESS